MERAYATVRCPLQRQMLGHTTSNMGLCGPSAEDTPLVPWLAKHGIAPRFAHWNEEPVPLPSPDRRNGGGGNALEGDVGHATSSRAGERLVDLRRPAKL